MKNILLSLVALFLGTGIMLADSPKREFRATWLATVSSIDWPNVKATSEAGVTSQKSALTDYFDRLVAGNMNACCLQVRSLSDALYKSSYEPWASCLTGTRGKDPGYDPLAFAIEEAHKRGIELHVWVNPYRVTSSGTLSTSDKVYTNCGPWLLKYDNGSFSGVIIDPGFPEARAYVVKVLMEIINNYDIDGILMDDYFYPYGGTTTEDATSLSLYKPSDMSAADWRRENVDKTMKLLYDSIQAVKPWVRFGMGPFGIWTTSKTAATKYGLTLPVGITGLDDYNVQFCNTVEWVKGGYVDYIAPQLYWATTSTGQCYHTLCQWWAQDVCKHFSDQLPGKKKVDFFVSQASYRFNTSEMVAEIDDNRKYDQLGCPGSIFYNTKSYLKDNGQGTQNMHLAVAKERFTSRALPPAMDWKTTTIPNVSTELTLDGTTMTWQNTSNCPRYTVYAYPKGMDPETAIANSAYLLGMTYTKSYDLSHVTDLMNMTIAVCCFDRYGNEYQPALWNAGEVLPYYTITVASASEDLGSVTGGGIFRSGSEIVITAMPTYGYVFDSWNDGNKENPRVITVEGNATYTASFRVQDPKIVSEGTISVSSLWTVGQTASGFMTTDNANRSIAYKNGKLYISDGATCKYAEINATDGKLIRTQTLPDKYFSYHNLRFTNDGQMLLGNSALQTNLIYTFKCDETNGDTTEMDDIIYEDFGRTDYFYTYGDWNKSGYLLLLSNTNQKVMYVPFTNGKLMDPMVASNSNLPSGTSAKAVPADENTFFGSVANKQIGRYSVWTGKKVDTWGRICPETSPCSGLGYFTLAQREYLALPADRKGSIEIWEITNGLKSATKVMDATLPIGSNDNTTLTIDFATYVNGNDAYIYVLAPNNGYAAYRMTFKPTQTGLESPTEENSSAVTEVYNINGMLLYRSEYPSEYIHHLAPGVYIIRQNGVTYKIAK